MDSVKIVQLFSGEVLMTYLDKGDDAGSYVMLREPYVIMLAPGPKGPTLAPMLWIPAALSTDHVVTVYAGAVAAMGDPTESSLATYRSLTSKLVVPSSGLVMPTTSEPITSPNTPFDQTITL